MNVTDPAAMRALLRYRETVARATEELSRELARLGTRHEWREYATVQHVDTNFKSYAEQSVTQRTGREIGEHLRELYVDRRFTDEEIGDLLGVARSTVIKWRRKYGIDRADRKAALA